MAKRQSVSWAELRVGMMVVGAFGLLFIAIIFMSEGLNRFRPTNTITAYFASANGMKRGAEVRLEGVTVGNVRNVTVEPDPLDSDRAVALEMRIDERYSIPSDAVLTIGTIGLLGDSVVEISRAGATGDAVGDGGEIQGEFGGDIQEIIQQTNDVIANLDNLSEQVVEITAGIERGEGTLGRFLTDESIFEDAAATMLEARRLVEDARAADGTIGRFIYDSEIYDRVAAAVTDLEAVVESIENGEGTLGLFINDRSLYDRADSLVASAEDIFAGVRNGEGTLGLMLTDEALFNNMSEAADKINAMVTDITNSEGTIGRLINDPSLYENFNQTVSEFLKLMYDFREDPGKFLTINFRLF